MGPFRFLKLPLNSSLHEFFPYSLVSNKENALFFLLIHFSQDEEPKVKFPNPRPKSSELSSSQADMTGSGGCPMQGDREALSRVEVPLTGRISRTLSSSEAS